MALKLYDYWRSSAAYRLRIALHLKGVAFESVEISLHPDVRAQHSDEYHALNPQMRVPAIEVDGQVVGQSMAILEWLEETYPTPSILPADPLLRLRARAFADTIACDVHPLNNPSVLNVLKGTYGANGDAISVWYADWITRGFTALETQVAGHDTPFIFGDMPTIAEITLIPQIYNAQRFNVDLTPFPTLMKVDAACQKLPAFAAATPEASKPKS